MMKIVSAFLLGLLLLGAPALAQTPPLVKPCVQTSATTCPPVTATNPLPVTPSAPSSGTYVGNVGGFEFAVTNTPTVQNAAYASGNAIGGLQTISAFRTTGGTGILNNIAVWSKGGSTVAMTLYIFNANPTASTCTDKTAFVLGAADIAKLIATTAPVLTPAVVGAGTTATSASQQLPVNVINGDSTVNLYVCAVVGGAVTPASTTDLVFKFSGVRD